jgi:hypothetical protein
MVLLLTLDAVQVVTAPRPGFHDLIGPTETIGRLSH